MLFEERKQDLQENFFIAGMSAGGDPFYEEICENHAPRKFFSNFREGAFTFIKKDQVVFYKRFNSHTKTSQLYAGRSENH